MNYKKFVTYNVTGGIIWITSLSLLGYYFGNIPFVKKNFEYVIIGVIILSVMPIVIGYINHRKEEKLKKEKALENQ